jgi:DNA-binding IclR family transcriptional regulator
MEKPDWDSILKENPTAGKIFQRVVASGTIPVGELLVAPSLDPKEIYEALAHLEEHGLVTHTGNYYSLSALGAKVARS